MGVLIFIMAVLPMGGGALHAHHARGAARSHGGQVRAARGRHREDTLYHLRRAHRRGDGAADAGRDELYEALLHAFATAGTGGFSTRNASLAAFDSAYIEMAISVFLLLFGVNFNLYYLAFAGRVRDALKSEELHCYLGILLVSTVSITLGITKNIFRRA